MQRNWSKAVVISKERKVTRERHIFNKKSFHWIFPFERNISNMQTENTINYTCLVCQRFMVIDKLQISWVIFSNSIRFVLFLSPIICFRNNLLRSYFAFFIYIFLILQDSNAFGFFSTSLSNPTLDLTHKRNETNIQYFIAPLCLAFHNSMGPGATLLMNLTYWKILYVIKL